MNVRTRIAPSPTGIAHIGTAYMALFNYAFAQQHHGEFIVRIEDTDRSRFVEGAEQVIYDSLAWLEIPHAEGTDVGGTFEPYKQSQRLETYKKASEELIHKGHAYYCFCTPQTLEQMRTKQQEQKQIPRYDGRCFRLSKEEVATRLAKNEPHVVRMHLPENEIISWTDLIRGKVEINTKELDDQVLMKSDGYPTYHLAVVVDDQAMQISHIIRGEEWISSTPKHILLYRFFGWQTPEFAHMPLLRNVDKTKMSKRKNDVSIPSYKQKGYLPQALRNYLCLLGWSHPEGKDIFSLEEFINTFTFERMQKTGPIFDVAKLNWMNGKYIREQMSEQELEVALQPFLPQDFPTNMLSSVVPLIKDRLVVLCDFEDLTAFFYRDIVATSTELIGKKGTKELCRQFLEYSLHALEESKWKSEEMETTLRDHCDAVGWNRGSFFMTLRVALTGRSVTPPLFETMQVIGKEKTLQRFHQALDSLQV